MPDAPVELEAVYNNLYTVTVDDGTTTRANNRIAGDIVTVQADVPAGEKFTGWKVENNTALSLNGQSIDLTQREITFNMPSTDITLTAEHKTIHTLYVVGGTIDGSTKSIQAIEGESITVHSALAPDQQFLHWKSEGMGLSDSQSKNDPLTITMPDGDVTITAVPNQLYTVTVVHGTVHDKSADTANPGDTVTAYKTIVKIIDPTQLSIQYTSSQLKNFPLGQEVTLTVDGEDFPGYVAKTPTNTTEGVYDDFPDILGNTDSIWCEFTGEQPSFLTVGMTADITAVFATHENAVVISKTLVKTDGDRSYVSILDENDNKVEVDVTVGITNATEAEILTGLKAGDRVVVR